MSRRRLAALGVLALSLVMVAVSCGDDDDSSSGSDSDKPTVHIASQAFGESETVAQIYGQVLEANGYTVTYQSFKDRASIYTALDGGDIDFVPEYAASGLEYLNDGAGEASPDITETAEKLREQLASKELQALEPTDAVNTNSLVVTKETAEADQLSSIADLKDTMKLGGPQDCPVNAGCIPALKEEYGLDMLQNFVPLDLSGPLTKTALENGDVDVAVIFSTDSSIAANDWVVLTDEKGIFNADNIIPVMTDELANDAELEELINTVSATLTTEKLLQMNERFDVDKEDAATIAKEFIDDEGLLS